MASNKYKKHSQNLKIYCVMSKWPYLVKILNMGMLSETKIIWFFLLMVKREMVWKKPDTYGKTHRLTSRFQLQIKICCSGKTLWIGANKLQLPKSVEYRHLKLKFDSNTFTTKNPKKQQLWNNQMFIQQIWKIHMSDLWFQRKICVVDQSERIHEHSFNLEFSRIHLLKDFMHDAKLGSPSGP